MKTLDLGKTDFKILGEMQTFPDKQGTDSLSSRPGLLRCSKGYGRNLSPDGREEMCEGGEKPGTELDKITREFSWKTQ